MGASLFESIPQEDRFAIMLSENAWNYREDDRYCYALGQDCFKTVSPVCPPGREPSFAGHLCVEVVRQERGLFGDYTVKELSPETRGRMLDRGNRLQKYNKWLLRYDALFPRNLR